MRVSTSHISISLALVYTGIILLSIACTTGDKGEIPMLELFGPKETGLDFRNDVAESLDNNIFRFTNFYNGGGVAVGDINNDGLADIY